MKLLRLLLTGLLAAYWLPGHAQSTTSPASAPASSEVRTTPEQRQAAEALLNTIYSESTFNQLIDKGVNAQLQLRPELKRFESEMRAFMRKYMSWAALKPDMIAMYARAFTEEELREITRFYQSPVGQKAASNLPVMMQQAMEISQRHVQEHLPELQKIFADKAASQEKHDPK